MDKQGLFDSYALLFHSWCPILDVKVAAFLSAQSVLETGWFKSEVFKNCNNLFGMRLPASRITISKGSLLNHAYFLFPSFSFFDYLLWLSSFGFNQADLKDLDRFVAKLRKSPYNPSENYVDTILKIFKTYYHD